MTSRNDLDLEQKMNLIRDKDEWNGGSGKILATDGISNEDTPHDEDPNIEQLPSLSETVKIVHRLHLLSTTQYPQLRHSLHNYNQSLLMYI